MDEKQVPQKKTSNQTEIKRTDGEYSEFLQNQNKKMLKLEEQKLAERKEKVRREMAAITIQLWWRRSLRYIHLIFHGEEKFVTDCWFALSASTFLGIVSG